MKRILPIKQARLNQSSLTDKKVVSIRISNGLLETIKQALENENLSTRKRSSWISHAIVLLSQEFSVISEEDKTLFIRQSQSITGEGKAVPVTLDEPAQKALNSLRNHCEKHMPDVKDTQSRLMHLAITLKLIKSGIKLA